MRRVPVGTVAVVAALVALVGTGTVTRAAEQRPAGPTAGPLPVPVVGQTLVCPVVRQGAGLVTAVSAGTVGTAGPPPAADPSVLSTVTTAALGAATPPAPLPLDARGRVATGTGTGVADDALLLTARGALAAGLAAEQLSRATGPERRGWASAACAPAAPDTWYAGGSTAVGESAALVLVNPDETPASVDVALWSAQGPLDARPGRGLLVPARSRRVVGLDALAPGRSGLALRVTATRGRVASAVEHTRTEAGSPRGTELVPPSPPPGAQVVVPGLPAGPGERALLVTNPGEDATVVQVQLTGGDGQFVPTGLGAVPVAAGSTTRIDLTDLLSGTAAAARVVSAVGPVLAVGLVVDGAGPTAELAYAGAAGPLTGPALVPSLTGSGSAVLLSALLQDATVVLTPLPVAGGTGPLPPPRTVVVPGGSTVVVPAAALGGAPGAPTALEVRPADGSGPVHAARLLRDDPTDGPLVTLLALSAAPESSLRPVVGLDPGA